MAAPCFLCGTDSVLEGLCSDCYNSEHPLIEVSTPLNIVVCKRCGAIKVPGGWKTLQRPASSPEEQMEQQIDVLLQKEVKSFSKGLELTVQEDKKLDRVLHVTLIVKGKSDESLEAHVEEYPVEIRFSYGTCDTCGMMSGGYHEAILQIRADNRPLTEEEEDQIGDMATNLTMAEYGKDMKAFIIEVNKTKFGLDFFLGSEHLTRRIADEIESAFLAERKENYKLIGQEKGGKDKFRITILLRLPRFSIGDFVILEKRRCMVYAIGRGGLGCYALADGSRFTVSPKSAKWRNLEFLADKTELREYMVVSKGHGQPTQLMDAKTFDMFEIDEGRLGSEITSGQTINAIELSGQLYNVPVDLLQGDTEQGN